MNRSFTRAKGLAVGGLLASLWINAHQSAIAWDGNPLPIPSASSEKISAPRSESLPTAPPAVMPAPATSAAPYLEGTPAEPKQEKPPESPWAKIPDLAPVPRPGWFILPPNGPGYYTLIDMVNGKCLEKPPPYPYRNLFYDNDFRYLDTPDGKPVDALDNLKRIHLGTLLGSCNDNWIFSIGGEERVQVKNEIASRLTARDNNYQLLRSRVYGDIWYKDIVRVYVEFLDARTFNEDLAPLPIDVNHADLQNAFVDVKVAEVDGHPAYVRIGRQELQYGSQRLISPLDWANTRRTFEGAKVFWHSDKLELDAFYSHPMIVSPSHFDSADWNQLFVGAFATYRPAKGQSLEAYYFYLDNTLPVPFGKTSGGRSGYDINTCGARYSGDRKLESTSGSILWDFDAAYQFGDWSNRSFNAGMATAGMGYAFNNLPMQPQFWAYYDYASGSPNPTGSGTFSTFDQLYPFGHYYFGYLDEIGRANIHDLNFQAVVFPAKWITFLTQWHIFRLDQSHDALYGTPPNYRIVRSDPTGRAGTNVGNEIDLLANFQIDRHNMIGVGFSKLFSGDFIKQTGPNVNPELFYLQWYLRW